MGPTFIEAGGAGERHHLRQRAHHVAHHYLQHQLGARRVARPGPRQQGRTSLQHAFGACSVGFGPRLEPCKYPAYPAKSSHVKPRSGGVVRL